MSPARLSPGRPPIDSVLYLRELQHCQRSGQATIRSSFLARRLGLSDSQIRRDLAQLGQLGKRGVGYDVSELIGHLRSVSGTDGRWPTVLVGLGNLGSALVGYRGFKNRGSTWSRSTKPIRPRSAKDGRDSSTGDR